MKKVIAIIVSIIILLLTITLIVILGGYVLHDIEKNEWTKLNNKVMNDEMDKVYNKYLSMVRENSRGSDKSPEEKEKQIIMAEKLRKDYEVLVDERLDKYRHYLWQKNQFMGIGCIITGILLFFCIISVIVSFTLNSQSRSLVKDEEKNLHELQSEIESIKDLVGDTITEIERIKERINTQ